jgi:hypothetical protein
MVLYQIWLARNDVHDSGCIENPETIAKHVVHLIEEWHSIQAPKPMKPPAPRERWLPSLDGWVKVNSDGAMAKTMDKGGRGVVIRDHDG